jgi:hypothetical protein
MGSKSIVLRESTTTNNGTLLFTSVDNSFNLNQIILLTIIREITGVFTIMINDEILTSLNGSNPTVANLTHTTSECMRISNYFTDIFEIKHTAI